MEDIWATGKNIVLIYNDSSVADPNADVWSGSTTYEVWPQVQAVGPLLEKIRQSLKERDQARIWGMSGTVTSDTTMIVKGLFPFQLLGPSSLESLMKQAVHPSLQNWLRGEFKDSINLVTTDWYNAKWTHGSYVRDILGSVDGQYL